MTGKSSTKIIQQLILMCYMFIKKLDRYPAYKTQLKSSKENHFFNASKPRRVELIYRRGIRSKHDGGFCCLNCLHSFRIKNKLESHKKMDENKDFCGVAMPSEDTKMLQFNWYGKFEKTPSIVFCRFSYAETWELLNLFVRTINFSYHSCYKN